MGKLGNSEATIPNTLKEDDISQPPSSPISKTENNEEQINTPITKKRKTLSEKQKQALRLGRETRLKQLKEKGNKTANQIAKEDVEKWFKEKVMEDFKKADEIAESRRDDKNEEDTEPPSHPPILKKEKKIYKKSKKSILPSSSESSEFSEDTDSDFSSDGWTTPKTNSSDEDSDNTISSSEEEKESDSDTDSEGWNSYPGKTTKVSFEKDKKKAKQSKKVKTLARPTRRHYEKTPKQYSLPTPVAFFA